MFTCKNCSERYFITHTCRNDASDDIYDTYGVNTDALPMPAHTALNTTVNISRERLERLERLERREATRSIYRRGFEAYYAARGVKSVYVYRAEHQTAVVIYALKLGLTARLDTRAVGAYKIVLRGLKRHIASAQGYANALNGV